MMMICNVNGCIRERFFLYVFDKFIYVIMYFRCKRNDICLIFFRNNGELQKIDCYLSVIKGEGGGDYQNIMIGFEEREFVL